MIARVESLGDWFYLNQWTFGVTSINFYGGTPVWLEASTRSFWSNFNLLLWWNYCMVGDFYQKTSGVTSLNFYSGTPCWLETSIRWLLVKHQSTYKVKLLHGWRLLPEDFWYDFNHLYSGTPASLTTSTRKCVVYLQSTSMVELLHGWRLLPEDF